jgi:tetratricopeptide (TPR) repeat protein
MRARGIPAERIVVAFEGSSAISELAASAVAGKADDSARAHAIFDAILALKRAGTIEGDRDNTPKARPPKTAAELLAGQDGHQKGGCYELSSLYVAAARSVGLDAVGVEREDAVGTGQIGHVMAGVRFVAGGPLTIFDLQNETRGTPARIRELDDLELAAHHYNHVSVSAFLGGDLDRALVAIDDALRLAESSPSFLNNRATILAAQGEPVLAIAEATHAVELAPAVPLYRYQLGRLLMVTGEIDSAIASLSHALALRPRYGLARRDLGWAQLLAGHSTVAKRELERAVRDDRRAPDTELYLGLFYLAEGDAAAALAVAERGLGTDADDEGLKALRRLAMHGGGRSDPPVERLRRVLQSVAAARRRDGSGGAALP